MNSRRVGSVAKRFKFEIFALLLISSLLGLWLRGPDPADFQVDGVGLGTHLDELHFNHGDDVLRGVTLDELLVDPSFGSYTSALVDDSYRVQAVAGSELTVGEVTLKAGDRLTEASRILGPSAIPFHWSRNGVDLQVFIDNDFIQSFLLSREQAPANSSRRGPAIDANMGGYRLGESSLPLRKMEYRGCHGELFVSHPLVSSFESGPDDIMTSIHGSSLTIGDSQLDHDVPVGVWEQILGRSDVEGFRYNSSGTREVSMLAWRRSNLTISVGFQDSRPVFVSIKDPSEPLFRKLF